jgi:hypothetical protein
MKKIILIITIFCISILNADVSGLITSIDKIKNSKQENREIKSIYNPFLNYSDKKTNDVQTFVKKSVKKTNNINLKLEAIFDDMAKIDSVWYKKGDKIDTIIVQEITNDKVILNDNGKKKILSIKSKNILKVTK